MDKKITLPDLGEGVQSATVAAILVKNGDSVSVDQSIVELETEKAVAEVPTDTGGTVKSIEIAVGDEISVGDLMLIISTDNTESPGSEKAHPKQESPVEKVDPEPEKPDQAKPDPPKQQKSAAEETKKDELKAEPVDEGELFPVVPDRPTNQSDIPAAPAVRRLADELGVDLSAIKPASEGQWLTEEDVKRAARNNDSNASTPQAKAPAAKAKTPDPTGKDAHGPIRREKLSKIRQTIAERMRKSRDNTVTLTNFDDADVTELEQFRRSSADSFKDEGVSMTLLSFAIKALAHSLKKHPVMNSTLDLQSNEIVYKHYVNIGMAVDTERGLVVPVIKNADTMSLVEIAAEITKLTEQCRSGNFDMSLLSGGSFTISNLGSVGGKYATPIINYPESAILLIGRAKDAAACYKGELAIRKMLPLSLSYDHQIIDGAAAGRFLREIIEYLETPAKLLTH